MPETNAVTRMAGAESAPHETIALARPQQVWLKVSAALGLASLFLALVSFNVVDIDIWHEMALIRESLHTGHLLTKDVFAYTPTLNPSIHHEWGAGLIAYALTRAFGGSAVLVLKYAMGIATGVLCWSCAENLGASLPMVTAFFPLGVYLSHFGFLPLVRAHVYSFLFAACTFWLFAQDRRGSRSWMVVWLILFPVWVNVHGGFVVGLGLLALYGVEQMVRRESYRHVLLLWVLSGLEVFVNPFGVAYVRYLWRALTMPRPFIGEWRPVWTYGMFWTTAVLFALLLAGYSMAKVGLRHAPGIVMLVGTAAEGILHVKLLPLFAVAWLCHVPAYAQDTPLGRWLTRFTERRFAFVCSAWIALAAVCLGVAIQREFWVTRVPQVNTTYGYPVGAVEYLRQQKFTGNLMVPFRQGAYVSWKLFPRVKVSLDSRYEVAFPEKLVDENFRFYAARPGWDRTLTAYPTDVVLVPTMAALAHVIAESGWQEVYVDDQFELYARPGLSLPFRDNRGKTFAGVFP